jgi:hypothetical protein
MDPLSRQIALTMTSTDGRARVIAHGDTLYLVTPAGEVWRVLDSDGHAGRIAPRNDPAVVERAFIASGAYGVTRVYRFSAKESRSTSAQRLVEQLDGAVTEQVVPRI